MEVIERLSLSCSKASARFNFIDIDSPVFLRTVGDQCATVHRVPQAYRIFSGFCVIVTAIQFSQYVTLLEQQGFRSEALIHNCEATVFCRPCCIKRISLTHAPVFHSSVKVDLEAAAYPIDQCVAAPGEGRDVRYGEQQA